MKKIYKNPQEPDKNYEEILVEIEEDETLGSEAKGSWNFIGYEFCVNFCMTGYRKDERDLGLLITEYLKPMCDRSLHLKTAGYLGTITDEDETYVRDFYLDEAQLKKEQANREFLCTGCKYRKEHSLCSCWEACFRAYGIGKEDKTA